MKQFGINFRDRDNRMPPDEPAGAAPPPAAAQPQGGDAGAPPATVQRQPTVDTPSLDSLSYWIRLTHDQLTLNA